MKTNGVKPMISLLLALCMLIVLVPSPSAAAEELSGKLGGGAAWTLSADGTLTIKGAGALTPGGSYVRYYSWPWYEKDLRSKIKSVVIGEGISSIDQYAFYECYNLSKVSLPSSLRSISQGVFDGCEGITEVSIPQGVTELGAGCFTECHNLQRVYLPTSIKKISQGVFSYTVLHDVYYGGTKGQWDGVDLYSGDSWPGQVEMHYSASGLPAPEAKSVQSTEWRFLVAIFRTTNASGTVDGKPCTIKNSLTEAEIQWAYKVVDTFKELLAGTGLVTPLVDVVLVDAPITELDDGGEQGPYPSSENVFKLLKNKGIDLSKYDHVTAYGTLSREVRHRFSGITHSIPLADNPGWSFVEGNDHGEAYKEYELKSRTILKEKAGVILHEFLHSMEYLSGYSFHLHEVEDEFCGYGTQGAFVVDLLLVKNQIKSKHGSGVPAEVWALPRTKLLKTENLVIPEGGTTVTGRLYNSLTNLKSLTLPGTVKSIEYMAFEGCKNLKTVSIPASVTEIGYGAFCNTGVTDVYYGGTEAQWKKITFTRDSGGKDSNDQLKNANIHFSSTMPQS